MNLNFYIRSNSPISHHFKLKGIHTFSDACNYIRNLPYKRNSNKNDLLSVFIDQYGTCSTKHALLKQLAIENKADHIKLILGVFKMNKTNTPQITATLEENGLTYILEAHNYLLVDNEILDCTKPNFDANNFTDDLIAETEIQPHQITDHKVHYHQQLLKSWLVESPEIKLSFDELWKIREQCINDISNHI